MEMAKTKDRDRVVKNEITKAASMAKASQLHAKRINNVPLSPNVSVTAFLPFLFFVTAIFHNRKERISGMIESSLSDIEVRANDVHVK